MTPQSIRRVKNDAKPKMRPAIIITILLIFATSTTGHAGPILLLYIDDLTVDGIEVFIADQATEGTTFDIGGEQWTTTHGDGEPNETGVVKYNGGLIGAKGPYFVEEAYGYSIRNAEIGIQLEAFGIAIDTNPIGTTEFDNLENLEFWLSDQSFNIQNPMSAPLSLTNGFDGKGKLLVDVSAQGWLDPSNRRFGRDDDYSTGPQDSFGTVSKTILLPHGSLFSLTEAVQFAPQSPSAFSFSLEKKLMVVIPEPTTGVLFGVGLVIAARARRKIRSVNWRHRSTSSVRKNHPDST
jgi:hypothetical protein